MAPLAFPAMLGFLVLSVAVPASAQDGDRQQILDRIAQLKATRQGGQAAASAPAPRFATAFRPRSAVSNYLAIIGDDRVFYRAGVAGAPDDDAKKLRADAELAVAAYEKLIGRSVTRDDDQKFASVDFFMRTGAAAFNPNQAQTAALAQSLQGLFAGGPVLQVDLIYEALRATNGNLTFAMGSLAQLFCDHRTEYIPKVVDMENADGKNYYRFAGFFIGLHGRGTRALGVAGSYANIGGNPVVYAGYEVYAWWRDALTGKNPKDVDTLKTLGPEGNGNIVDKGGELHKGFDAAEAFRSAR